MQAVKNAVRHILEKGLNLISPCSCFLCGMNDCRDEIPVCGDCIGTFYRMLNTPCPSCGRAISGCDCSGETLAFLFWYSPGEAHRIIGAVKNDADRRMIRFFAELLALRIKQLHKKPFEAVTYIPRRKKGIRAAGYDQAKLLAEETAKALRVPCVAMLRRHGSEEQKLLSASERRKTMKNRYSVIRDNVVSESGEPYARVLLIDDVCTTGATLDACSALLRQEGIKQVISAVIAKTPKKEGWMTLG